MKRALLSVLFCLISASVCAAPISQQTYVALFLDDSHSGWCVTGSPPYSVELWIWVLPGASGLGAISFDMSYPANVEYVAHTHNPNTPTQAVKCSPPCPYFAFPLVTCLTERSWTWFYHETLLVTSSDPVAIAMTPFPAGNSSIMAGNCQGMEEPAVTYSNIYVNHGPSSPACAGLGAESATWGAVKALYR